MRSVRGLRRRDSGHQQQTCRTQAKKPTPVRRSKRLATIASITFRRGHGLRGQQRAGQRLSRDLSWARLRSGHARSDVTCKRARPRARAEPTRYLNRLMGVFLGERWCWLVRTRQKAAAVDRLTVAAVASRVTRQLRVRSPAYGVTCPACTSTVTSSVLYPGACIWM